MKFLSFRVWLYGACAAVSVYMAATWDAAYLVQAAALAGLSILCFRRSRDAAEIASWKRRAEMKSDNRLMSVIEGQGASMRNMRRENDQLAMLVEAAEPARAAEKRRADEAEARAEDARKALVQARAAADMMRDAINAFGVFCPGGDEGVVIMKSYRRLKAAAKPRDPRCNCPLPYRAIVPETHEESCPVVN